VGSPHPFRELKFSWTGLSELCVHLINSNTEYFVLAIDTGKERFRLSKQT
jgi:hypothetical protein